MDLLHLRYFLTVAKYEHMTKAAQHLHIAQPALSQSIKQLETELGVYLFDRKSRGIVLNDSGKLLQVKLEPLIAAIDNLPTLLQEHKNEADHTIHLNLLAASSTITHFIISYKSLHPDVKFYIHQGAEQTYDLSISTLSYHEPILKSSEILLTEDFYLAVPITSPFSSYSSIRLIDTKAAEYISFGKSRPLRAVCDLLCMQAGFIPNIVFESNDPESVRNLIAAGIGIGFWPAHSWGSLHTPQVKLLPIDTPICKRHIIMNISASGKQKPIVLDFCDFIRNNFAKL